MTPVHFRFKSLRSQLLLSFLSLSMVLLLIIILSLVILNQTEQVRQVKENVVQLQEEVNKLVTYENSFLQVENKSLNFHSTGEHALYSGQMRQIRQVQQQLEYTQEMGQQVNFDMGNQFNKLNEELARHDSIFNLLIDHITKRGFKDYGQEGLMRKFIHALEDSTQLPKADILMLRRHEKDYLLRSDPIYIAKLDTLVHRMLKELISNPQVRQEEIVILSQYQEAFHELVHLYDRIGNDDEGLKKDLIVSQNQITETTGAMIDYAEFRHEALQANLRQMFYFVLAFFFILSIILSFRLANYRSKPLNQLSEAISNLSLSKDQKTFNVELTKPSRELNDLYESFRDLFHRYQEQLNQTEEANQSLKKQNEELQKVNSELDHFVYSVSHDIRSPLASLLGLVNLAKNETDLEKIRECLDHQESSLQKLDHFIKDVLALSRNARQEIKLEILDVRSMVEEIAHEAHFAGQLQHIKVEVDMKEDWPVVSDFRRIKVLLNNLITNAIRYANVQDNAPWVKVTCRASEEQVEISVEDNGIGIKEEHLDKIFNMFYRGNDKIAGSGLGLYIAKETLDKLGGTINVASRHNEGSKFTIRFPNHSKKLKISVA